MKTRPSRSSEIPADILMTLPDLGINVEKIRGDEAWSKCPAHFAMTGKDDRSASWSIHLETGEHHCFSCGWGGPYVVLVKWQNNWDDEKASEWIRKHGGFETAKRRMRGESTWEKKKAEEVTEADLVFFDDPPREALKSRDVDLESCRAYGVLWDSKTSRWIFPIRDPYTNALMGWQAKGKRVFLNHPEHVDKSLTLFGSGLLLNTKNTTAYLYESPIDPVRMHTYGLDGAVSSYGVHVSEAQLDFLVDTVDTLYLCLDNDEAGRKVEADIWEKRRKQVRLMFTNYSHTNLKDHGEMPIADVEWSLNNAISSVRYRP